VDYLSQEAPLPTDIKQLAALNEITQGCVLCNLCVKECAFLQQYGSPGTICRSFLEGAQENNVSVFSCNLCGLCQAMCPKNLDCPAAFLEIRRTLQKNSPLSIRKKSVDSRHKTICDYEARGASPLFSLYLLPEGCDTIFFPGCTLSATRSSVTQAIYTYLKSLDSTIGIVLDCCMKPSHDLGLQVSFAESFIERTDHLTSHNIKRIFTACPSCYTTFKAYAPSFEICSIYEWLAEHQPPRHELLAETVTIHDACATRSVAKIHNAVRTLVEGMGAGVEETRHTRDKAICCGEGAAASFVAPAITAGWRAMRKSETSGRRVITYCAGCANTLGKDVHTTHLLDLLFDCRNAIQGKEKVTKAPFTYINRLLLKNRLKKSDNSARVGRRRWAFLILPISALAGFFATIFKRDK
jgi:Fe-S oxidoreductase